MPQSFLEQCPPGEVRGLTLPVQLTQQLKVSNCLIATMSALEMWLEYSSLICSVFSCTRPMSATSSIFEPSTEREILCHVEVLNHKVSKLVGFWNHYRTSNFSSHNVTIITPEESATTTSCLVLPLCSLTGSPFDNTFIKAFTATYVTSHETVKL